MKRSVLISLVLMAVSNLSFAALAAAGHTNIGMAAAVGFENFASGIGGVTVVAYLSALCNLRFTATQYALLSALASIAGRFLTGTTAGALIDRDRLRELLPAHHADRASRRDPVLVHDPLRPRRPVDRLGGQGSGPRVSASISGYGQLIEVAVRSGDARRLLVPRHATWESRSSASRSRSAPLLPAHMRPLRPVCSMSAAGSGKSFKPLHELFAPQRMIAIDFEQECLERVEQRARRPPESCSAATSRRSRLPMQRRPDLLPPDLPPPHAPARGAGGVLPRARSRAGCCYSPSRRAPTSRLELPLLAMRGSAAQAEEQRWQGCEISHMVSLLATDHAAVQRRQPDKRRPRVCAVRYNMRRKRPSRIAGKR